MSCMALRMLVEKKRKEKKIYSTSYRKQNHETEPPGPKAGGRSPGLVEHCSLRLTGKNKRP